MLLRILLGTFVLTSLVVAAAFWLISRNPDHDKDKIILSLNDKDKHPGVELKYYIVTLMVVLVTPPLVSPSSVQSLAPYFES